MKKYNSIKSRLIIYLTLFTAIPLIIASTVTLYSAYNSKKDELFYKHKEILKNVQQDIDGMIHRIEHLSAFVEKRYAIKKHAMLVGLINLESNLNSILILDRNGKLKDFHTKHKSKLFNGYDFSNTRNFEAITNGANSFWSKVYISNTTQAPAISYTKKISENKIAVLVLDLGILHDIAKKYRSGDGSSMIRIIDSNGVFLAHPDTPEFVLQRKSVGTIALYKKYLSTNQEYKQIIFKNMGQFSNIGIYGKSKDLGWYVLVKERYEYVFEVYFTIFSFLVFFIILLILISIFFAIKLSKSVLKPLSDVSDKMNKVAEGEYIESIINNSYVELQQLIRSFFIMQEKIKKREQSFVELNQSLERRVDEKTKELQKLNESLEERITKEVESSRQKELHILESSKMVQMGEMIGNIAHQWRQPLSVISTAASGMKLEKEYGVLDDNKIVYYCDSIIQNTEHLSETIEIFRNFIKEKKETGIVVLQDRLELSIKIVAATLESNHIKIRKQIDTNTPIKLNIVIGELSQVVINILNNSKDALLENKVEEPWIKLSCKEEKKWAIITIEDNGGGIKEDIISKIFDPYFTTKHKSQGTGLGLHMSYKIIVESLKGKISAKNTENGALFTIELPILLEE